MFIMFIMFCRLLIFFQNIQEYYQCVIHFDPDQVRFFVRADLGQTCLLKGYQQMTLVG